MKNEISSHLVTSHVNLAPKNIRRVPWGHDTIAQTHAHITSICSSVSGSETLPTLLKFSPFSAQISGFSADFHRKLLDIVKQHPKNAEIWADSVFQPSN